MNSRISVMLVIAFLIIHCKTLAQQTISWPDFHHEQTTRDGNTWSIDIRNIKFEYTFPQFVTSRKDKSTMTGGFADDGSVKIQVVYVPVANIVWNGTNIPLSEIKGGDFIQFSVGNFTADIFSGNRFIKKTDLSTQGGMYGKLSGSRTQPANQPVSWKKWLGVSTMDEVNDIFDAGLNLRNLNFNIQFSSSAIGAHIDKLAKEQGIQNEATNENMRESQNTTQRLNQNSSENQSIDYNSALSSQNSVQRNQQAEYNAWKDAQDRQSRQFTQDYERRIQQANQIRQQKQQMVEESASRVAGLINQIAEQKRREDEQRKHARNVRDFNNAFDKTLRTFENHLSLTNEWEKRVSDWFTEHGWKLDYSIKSSFEKDLKKFREEVDLTYSYMEKLDEAREEALEMGRFTEDMKDAVRSMEGRGSSIREEWSYKKSDPDDFISSYRVTSVLANNDTPANRLMVCDFIKIEYDYEIQVEKDEKSAYSIAKRILGYISNYPGSMRSLINRIDEEKAEEERIKLIAQIKRQTQDLDIGDDQAVTKMTESLMSNVTPEMQPFARETLTYFLAVKSHDKDSYQAYINRYQSGRFIKEAIKANTYFEGIYSINNKISDEKLESAVDDLDKLKSEYDNFYRQSDIQNFEKLVVIIDRRHWNSVTSKTYKVKATGQAGTRRMGIKNEIEAYQGYLDSFENPVQESKADQRLRYLRVKLKADRTRMFQTISLVNNTEVTGTYAGGNLQYDGISTFNNWQMGFSKRYLLTPISDNHFIGVFGRLEMTIMGNMSKKLNVENTSPSLTNGALNPTIYYQQPGFNLGLGITVSDYLEVYTVFRGKPALGNSIKEEGKLFYERDNSRNIFENEDTKLVPGFGVRGEIPFDKQGKTLLSLRYESSAWKGERTNSSYTFMEAKLVILGGLAFSAQNSSFQPFTPSISGLDFNAKYMTFSIGMLLDFNAIDNMSEAAMTNSSPALNTIGR